MWIPRDTAEIEAAAGTGQLEETASFDAKRELPATPRKNSDVAEDVAAMSTDGGALLYGIEEDEHKRPTIPRPIPLAGAADRIGQIVATSIAEVPYIDVREYPCDDDPSKGYLLVLVPQSARAPHQVTVGGDLRFYGRGAKGNRRLTEGDVARLYQRRQEWQENRDVLLAEAVAQAPFAPQDDLAYLHAFVRPVAPDRATWDRAVAAAGQRSALQQQLDFQLAATGMFPVRMRLGHRVYHAPERVLRARDARPRPGCRWCDRHAPAGAFGRGDDHPLPLRSESAPRPAPNGAREWIGRLLRPR